MPTARRGDARYLCDAERAFTFIAAQGWDASGGGLWWNTSHPYEAGEALAAGSLLGALLYQHTHNPFYLSQTDAATLELFACLAVAQAGRTP